VAPSVAPSAPAASAPAPAPVTAPLVVFLGDSLTAGYGLSEEQSFPSILSRWLAAEGRPVRIVNAGVSGDTSAGGLARLGWILQQKPDVLVVGLGANDALRGQPLDGVEANLTAIVRRSQAAGAKVLILGLMIPVNYGPGYSEGFSAIYPRVARATGAGLVPFLLEGVGGHAELNLADGLHPNAAGQEIVARNVLPQLKRLLGDLP
jgi:acyl-CoA thioesterase-1